jgi:4'-phosphopantetheinyl transferase
MAPSAQGTTRQLLWPTALPAGSIAPGEVHLWSWTFDRPGTPADEELRILNDLERQRTFRFRFPVDQVRFCVCRANMRRLLASYIGRAPESLVFSEDTGGKPGLAEAMPLRFNLSHSKTLAVLAVTIGGEIGVDVEDIRPIEADVAKRFFSAREVASLGTLSDWEEWLAGFYRCWTRKEAVLKAEGAGLRIPLDSFDVSLLADEPAALLEARPEAKLTADWRLHSFSPAEGVAGALAFADPAARILEYALEQ